MCCASHIKVQREDGEAARAQRAKTLMAASVMRGGDSETGRSTTTIMLASELVEPFGLNPAYTLGVDVMKYASRRRQIVYAVLAEELD
jgi:hypothetical protein